MTTTNHERVGKAMELLRDGLAPFVHRQVTAKVKAGTVRRDAIRRFAGNPQLANKSIGDWDVAALLKLMWVIWNDVFRGTLGFTERGLVSELRDWRNKWAHQERFDSDDADRALDSAQRLLAAIAAPQADAVARIKRELRRLELDEEVRSERRRTADRAEEHQEHAFTSNASQADRIRHHALRCYVEPWRGTEEQQLSIRAGDVQRELSLRGVTPNVCNALRGRKFLALANVKLIGHTEPCPSTTTVFRYERN